MSKKKAVVDKTRHRQNPLDFSHRAVSSKRRDFPQTVPTS
jgi:hypothetical protein